MHRDRWVLAMLALGGIAMGGAYGPSTMAGGACDEGGTARWCACAISSPVRPDLWSSYDTW